MTTRADSYSRSSNTAARATVFSSAEAALESVNEHLPTLIISDISMPEMTGLEFARRLRARSPTYGGLIPAIAITAYYEDFIAVAAREVGFDGYLMKPINFEALRNEDSNSSQSELRPFWAL
jgi:CheY-like chemotaxis protein